MKLKHALIASAVWTVIGLAGCVALVVVIAGSRPTRAAEQRAAQAGGGAGTVMVIGYGAIWLPFAAAVGKRRREAAAKRKGRRDAA